MATLPERKHTQYTQGITEPKSDSSTDHLAKPSGSVTGQTKSGRLRPSLDCTELFSSDICQFLIGEEEVAFKVHSGALKGLSEPLWYMLNNSIMQESVTKTVRMPELEPRTFVQFLKSVYLGYCGISDGIRARDIRQSTLPSHFRCHNCTVVVELRGNEHYPFHDKFCRSNINPYAIVEGLGRSNILLCPSHRKTNVGRSYPIFGDLDDPEPHTHTSAKCGGDFLKRHYGCGKLSHTDLSRLLDLHNDVEKSANLNQDQHRDMPLLDHAKLYIFADQYLIEDLRDISIHKLHRNLTEIEITKKTIGELTDLVTCSYEGTADEGDIQKGSADRLRSLVMAFVIDRKEELMSHASFRHMLGSGGPQTADFFGLMFPS